MMEKVILIKVGSSIYSLPENITLEEIESAIGQPLPQNILDQFTEETSAIINFSLLPDWLKTWTADEAAGYVHDNVLNGFDVAAVDAYVDGLPNTFAGMKTGLKLIGGALVAIRDILEIIAKLLMYISDLVIKHR